MNDYAVKLEENLMGEDLDLKEIPPDTVLEHIQKMRRVLSDVERSLDRVENMVKDLSSYLGER